MLRTFRALPRTLPRGRSWTGTGIDRLLVPLFARHAPYAGKMSMKKKKPRCGGCVRAFFSVYRFFGASGATDRLLNACNQRSLHNLHQTGRVGTERWNSSITPFASIISPDHSYLAMSQSYTASAVSSLHTQINSDWSIHLEEFANALRSSTPTARSIDVIQVTHRPQAEQCNREQLFQRVYTEQKTLLHCHKI